MQDFTKRRNKGSSIRRFLLGIGIVALLGFIAFGAVRASWGMYGKFAEAATANVAAQQNLAQMKAEKQSVEAEVDQMQSPVGQEGQLRQSYGVALPGEGEIQIVRQPASTTAAAAGPSDNYFVRMLKALYVW